MTLFLSRAFLRRLSFVWKSGLAAFLVGERNLYFFIPDSAVEVSEITPESINQFLENYNGGPWELLGYLTPSETGMEGCHMEVVTFGSSDPTRWKAQIQIPFENEWKPQPLDIQVSK